MQMMIDGHLDELGTDIADGLESARRVEPVETEDHIGRANGVGGFLRKYRAAGRAGLELL